MSFLVSIDRIIISNKVTNFKIEREIETLVTIYETIHAINL